MSELSPLKLFGRMAVSLIVPLLVFCLTAAFMSIPPETHGIDVNSGHELFTVHCESCHFTKAGFPAHIGPNLFDIGMSAATRKPNESAAKYILESIVDPNAFIAPGGRPGMPPNVAAGLDPKDIRNIVGYLASCGAFPNYDEIQHLDIPDRRQPGRSETRSITLEQMQLAENVLHEKGACLKCHSRFSAPEDTVFAPPLFGAGLNDVETIREALLDPNKIIKTGYESVTVLQRDGKTLSGRLVGRTSMNVVLAIRDEQSRLQLRQIPISEIETENGQPEIRKSKVSQMPSDLGKTLSTEELDAVVNLIRQLN